jgi:hypothetical protein
MWRDLETDPPTGDDCVILFPQITDVGIMYIASNPDYARQTALKNGYTHWMEIPRHEKHDEAKQKCLDLRRRAAAG